MAWAVLNTQPCAEKRALWHLKFQGFPTYAPREKLTRVHRGRRVSVERWLFPRYIFVWITTHWHALFSTIGVSRVLMTGDKPSHVPESWIASLRARERNGLITLPKPPRFKIGQRVQVISGLFGGARGLYQGTSSRQREIVILEALGARIELASGLLR